MRFAVVRQKSLRLSALLAFGAFVWIFSTGRWTAASWRVPAAYGIDALEVLTRFKLSGESGPGFLFDKVMPHLGAPWGADWSAYPMPDAPVFILFGLLAKWVGLIPASNLALLFSHLAAIATFYGCSRALGHRSIYSAAAAVLFGFSFYHLHRGLSHYSFALTYVIPAQLLSAWLIGSSQRLLNERRWQWFCLATAVATGIGNPYFGFGFCQLMLLALAYQALTRRRRINLTLGAGCLVVLGVTLFAFNYSSVFHLLGEKPGLLQRNYASTEIYGLRPIELFIPPVFHRWAPAAEIGARYASATSLKGELFFPYLGFAGMAGVLVLGLSSVRQAIRQRWGLRPSHTALFVWLTLFFVVGGLNSLLAFAGFDLFRAGNRYTIYLLALALFALTSWASRQSRHLAPWMAGAVAALVAMIGLWDQLPRRPFRADVEILGKKVAGDQKLAARLDEQLPEGAAIFQLPVVPFLEQPPVHRMMDYELFRVWLFSEKIRFSYGLLDGDKGLRWQKWVATRPVAVMCAELEKAGYAALYLHKKAFPDAGAGLSAQLIALGRLQLANKGDHQVFALRPATVPILPDLNAPWLSDSWSEGTIPAGEFPVYADSGWFGLERNQEETWRWAGENAALTIWNPESSRVTATLAFGVTALRRAPVTVTFGGREIGHVAAGQAPGPEVSLAVTLEPGANLITFHFAGRLTKPSATDRRLLGFRLVNLRARATMQPSASALTLP